MAERHLGLESGSALPMVVGLAFAAFLTLLLAVEVGRWGATVREAAFAADAGAAAGAAMIDEAAAYRGSIQLDVLPAISVATSAANAARPRAERTATAVATTDEVCVTVTQPFVSRLLSFLGAEEATITSTACASPARG